MNKKKIIILGSTGSVGTQALEVVAFRPDLYEVIALTADRNADLLIAQALIFRPRAVVISNEKYYQQVKDALSPHHISVLGGDSALCEVVEIADAELVLAAIMGFAGLAPVLSAIKAGKDVALANKEPLVVAGQLVMKLAQEHEVRLLPVDSEHSAIFQCLTGEKLGDIEKIYLTASGGPFRGKDLAYLSGISVTEALRHPNWAMGKKITIDSASLMNKGLEVIEAKWLFDLKPEQIDVIIHPQSIVHSLVQFYDGSIKAQLGLPDMKLPIQYALHAPARLANNFKRFDFLDYPELSFYKADTGVFRNLALAYDALYAGGIMPCILNAANEVVVDAFLNENIGFTDMSNVIAEVMSRSNQMIAPDLEDYLFADAQARRMATQIIEKQTKNYFVRG